MDKIKTFTKYSCYVFALIPVYLVVMNCVMMVALLGCVNLSGYITDSCYLVVFRYCRLVKLIWLVTENLKGLDSRDSFRVKSTEALLEKLLVTISQHQSFFTTLHRYSMGIISTRKSLALCDKVTASSFCR